MLIVSAAAAASGITEKPIGKALKDGRLASTVDTSPGRRPKGGTEPASGRRCVQDERLRSTLRLLGPFASRVDLALSLAADGGAELTMRHGFERREDG
jgi:hypothetical protein